MWLRVVASHLGGDQLQDQVAVSLHAGGTGAWFQLKPAVSTRHRHLLRGARVGRCSARHPVPLLPSRAVTYGWSIYSSAVESFQIPVKMKHDLLWDSKAAQGPMQPTSSGHERVECALGIRGYCPEMPTSAGAPPTHPPSILGHHTHPMSLSHPSSHTRTGTLRHPRKSSVWSSVGPAVPFARADLTICLKYLGTTRWTARRCHSGGPGKLLAPLAKLHAHAHV